MAANITNGYLTGSYSLETCGYASESVPGDFGSHGLGFH
jgi:hypothetical protein